MQCDASTKNKFAWGFCASGCLGMAICAEVNKFVFERLVGVAIVTKARCCCACWLGSLGMGHSAAGIELGSRQVLLSRI